VLFRSDETKRQLEQDRQRRERPQIDRLTDEEIKNRKLDKEDANKVIKAGIEETIFVATGGVVIRITLRGGKVVSRVVVNSKAGQAIAKKAKNLMPKKPGTGTPKKTTVAPVYCFVAGTPVATPDGEVPIEHLEEGDVVISYDFELGRYVERTVLSTSVASSDRQFEIILEDGVSILTTPGHPFWVPSRQEWVRAEDLTEGMNLMGADRAPQEITRVVQHSGAEVVFNLRVEGTQNYLVGTSRILVHNGGPEAYYDDYEKARNAAMDWLHKRGFRAEKPTEGKFGPNKGKAIGMQSADGRKGFRVEFDKRSGAHINVWDHDMPRTGKGNPKGYPHFKFKGDQESVNKIVKRFQCP